MRPYTFAITPVVGILVSLLVSKGLIDIQSQDFYIQLLNDVGAALIPFVVALYSVYKSFELHKHHMTLTSTQQTTVTSTPSQTQQVTETTQTTEVPVTPIEEQTGLPLE